MLKRLGIRQFRAIQPRKISTASSPYDNYTKLRAIPFSVGPERALRMLSPCAAVACNDIRKMHPSFGALALALPYFNSDFLRPARFSAVYFPAWCVTGEVEANVTCHGVQSNEIAWFNNTCVNHIMLRTALFFLTWKFPLVISQVSPSYLICIPPLLTVYLGSHVAVLSAAPLMHIFLKQTETVPFTSFLLHQHGEPVQCIPFSTSPFSVFDVAASHPPSRSIAINEDISIDPSSVKSNLIFAYPVLLPLYLAQYEIQDGNDSANDMLTFIFRAYGKPGIDSVMCENLSKGTKFSRNVLERLSAFSALEYSSEDEVHTLFAHPQVFIRGTSMQKNISHPFSEWLEELLRSSSNIEILAESSLGVIGKGDEDLRIREMGSVGTSLEKYVEITASVMRCKRSLNSLNRFERNPRDSEQANQTRNSFSMARKGLEEDLKVLEAERVQVAPTWWLEWLALNRPKSQNTVQSAR